MTWSELRFVAERYAAAKHAFEDSAIAVTAAHKLEQTAREAFQDAEREWNLALTQTLNEIGVSTPPEPVAPEPVVPPAEEI